MPEKKELARKPRAKTTTPSQRVIDKAVKDAVEKALAEERYAIGKTKFTCRLCGKLVDVSKRGARAEMYKSTDPNCKTGYSCVCRDCIEKIVYRIEENDPDKRHYPPTKESIQCALEYLDRPWNAALYERSIAEAADKDKERIKDDVWQSYIKNIQSLPQYRDLRWKDGDKDTTSVQLEQIEKTTTKEVFEGYEKNKKVVVHALGYDPFAMAPEEWRPLMYSQLLGYMDESTNQDEFKLAACIEIVQSRMQSSILNEKINNKIMSSGDISSLIKNKKDLDANAMALAKDNGISINYSNKNTKGSNTFTGQLKEIKEKNLREHEMNAFDVETCEGIRQVAEISAEAIINKIRLDENDYADIIANQRNMVTEATQKCSAAEEEARILRRENDDLKELLQERGIIDKNGQVIV